MAVATYGDALVRDGRGDEVDEECSTAAGEWSDPCTGDRTHLRPALHRTVTGTTAPLRAPLVSVSAFQQEHGNNSQRASEEAHRQSFASEVWAAQDEKLTG